MEYYKALGVDKNADQDKIKKAYRKTAMECHPDRNPDDKKAEEKFKLVNEAYSVLSDPEKRQIYDQHGKDGLKAGGHSAPNQNPHDIFNDLFGGAFGDFFGSHPHYSHQQRQQNIKGSNLRIEVEVGLKDLIFGSKIEISFPRQHKCLECDGDGGDLAICDTCHGAGQVSFIRGFMNLTTTCSKCSGHGRILKEPCKSCSGRRTISIKETVDLEIPVGLRPEQQMILHGFGNKDTSSVPGDLIVSFRLKKSRFEISGNDFTTNINIDCIDACLGCEIKIQTLDGEKKVKIPQGIQQSKKIKLAHLGFPIMNSKVRGSLFLNVNIKIPEILSEDQKQALIFVRESRKNV